MKKEKEEVVTLEKNETPQIFTQEEAVKSATAYFRGDELAGQVWVNKYALKDSDENIYENTPKMMHDRLASEIHRIEQKYPNPMELDEIKELIYDFKYIIPQGSPMAGIGNDYQTTSLSNCFVIGDISKSDSYGGVMKTDEEQVHLMKRRGGVGHDLSHIRPKGSPVKNSALTSTGVVPFMERYSNSTREVAQDGRRGALMLSLSILHNDAEDFINAKMDSTKVTGANVSVKITDNFMEAVKKNKPFVQQFPIDSDNPKFTKEVKAKELWDKMMHNAWKSAEPGILFWDKVISESLPDKYADLGYETVSTNPCLTKDTLVSVADGRNFVSIGDLEKEGKDVPVYCLDDKGKIAIRTMRNPRITGHNEKIYKVTIEGNHEIRVTSNHKFRLKDGTYKEAKDLENGDSLHIMTKHNASFDEVFENSNSNSSDYVWINNGKLGFKSEHRIVYEQLNDTKIPRGSVIHHKDYNSLNNNIENLQMMTRKEHDHFHSKDMICDKNPYHRMTEEWKRKFASHPGESNSNYNNITNKEIIEHAKILTDTLSRRFSKKEWIDYAKENNLPQHFSEYRHKELGNVITLSKRVSLELGYDNIDTDPRLVKSYKSALDNGYDVTIDENRVLVTKTCENCNNDFDTDYRRREISFCSQKCAVDKTNNNVEVKENRTNSVNKAYEKKGIETKEKQVKIASDLKFKLGRTPMLKEWEKECKDNNIPCRLKIKYGFQNFKEVLSEAEYYNHKVISVEEDGYEDVYNGTVDNFHNFFSGGFEEKTKTGKPKYLSINNLQCGEIPLCPDDSCRLLAVNLLSYVVNPFTKDAYFDFDLFKKHSRYALRFMDDIVDLEIEKIDKIISKINSDPEPEHIKRNERALWERIQQKCKEGRRTGVGITAEGDMLAALGLRYGTKKATEFAEKVHMNYALEVYRSSNELAKERGAFGIFDPKREKDAPFLLRIKEQDPKLYKSLMKHGRRNIACLTIAPTGSVSIMTQTSSGVEPVFMVAYKRRRKINPNDKNAKSTFVDEVGDHWEEYNVFHHGFEKWIRVTGYKYLSNKEKDLPLSQIKEDSVNMLIEKSPYYKAMANDVDWVEKVRMQGKLQKWVDHSISVTVNLPEHVSEELVSKVYMTAWEEGCKGCTIYRDGSRSGVLVSNDEKKKEEIFKDVNAPKRPEKLECVVMNFQNKGEKWIGFLGLMDGRPYEIFTGALDNFPVPSYVEKGIIQKIKNDDGSTYNFIYEDKNNQQISIPNLNYAFDKRYYDSAKTFSAILRHGMPIPYVIQLIDGLNLDGDLITTWKAGVKRMLKKFIKDGAVLGKKCEECGSEELEYIEGCLTCRGCGSSACS